MLNLRCVVLHHSTTTTPTCPLSTLHNTVLCRDGGCWSIIASIDEKGLLLVQLSCWLQEPPATSHPRRTPSLLYHYHEYTIKPCSMLWAMGMQIFLLQLWKLRHQKLVATAMMKQSCCAAQGHYPRSFPNPICSCCHNSSFLAATCPPQLLFFCCLPGQLLTACRRIRIWIVHGWHPWWLSSPHSSKDSRLLQQCSSRPSKSQPILKVPPSSIIVPWIASIHRFAIIQVNLLLGPLIYSVVGVGVGGVGAGLCCPSCSLPLEIGAGSNLHCTTIEARKYTNRKKLFDLVSFIVIMISIVLYNSQWENNHE